MKWGYDTYKYLQWHHEIVLCFNDTFTLWFTLVSLYLYLCYHLSTGQVNKIFFFLYYLSYVTKIHRRYLYSGFLAWKQNVERLIFLFGNTFYYPADVLFGDS